MIQKGFRNLERLDDKFDEFKLALYVGMGVIRKIEK